MPNYWTVSPEWKGETVFIIGGGPSVADQNVESLRGRKVIVINSSCYDFSWADILFFADLLWWSEHKNAVKNFAGRCVTTDPDIRGDNILHLKRRYPAGTKLQPGAKSEQAALVLKSGLAIDRSELVVLKTSMTAAINLAVHLGAKRIALLGADGGPKDGRTHHHKPHNRGQVEANWKLMREELATLVEPLRELGIDVVNCSLGSLITCWPIMSLEEFLQMETP